MPLDDYLIAGYTNAHTPTPNDTIANYDLAALTSTGLALDALEGPLNLPGGRMGYQQHCKWIAGPAPTEEAVRGVVIFEAGDPNVFKAAELFAVPVQIAKEGDALAYDLVFALPNPITSGLT